VGANRGQFARYAAALFPRARIYSFEPLPGPFAELKAWAERQTRTRVTALNVALGDTEGKADMFEHLEHSPSSSLLQATNLTGQLYPFTRTKRAVTVELSTLDRVFNSDADTLEREILVKMDVQGFEARVIRGGRNILSKARACLLEVNMDRLYDHQATFDEIFSLLSGCGYSYAGNLHQTHARDGHIIYLDALFTRP
jgi:FkbM family methyltransferase